MILEKQRIEQELVEERERRIKEEMLKRKIEEYQKQGNLLLEQIKKLQN